MESILLTPKIHPDLDGVACAYAYQKLLVQKGNHAFAILYGRPHIEAQYVLNRFHINDILSKSEERFDKYILCDASDLKGMPDNIQPEAVIEVVDHREVHDASTLFPNARITIEMVGAAATLIAEKYRSAGMVLDEKSAMLLYGAIYSNTLNLKANVTTNRDKEILTWIESNFPIPSDFISDMFETKSKGINDHIEGPLIDDAKEFEMNGVKFGIAQLEVYGSVEVLKQKKKILDILTRMKEDLDLSWNFLTIADFKTGENIFISPYKKACEILSKAFGISFEGNIGRYNMLILRKEIIPKLKVLIN